MIQNDTMENDTMELNDTKRYYGIPLLHLYSCRTQCSKIHKSIFAGRSKKFRSTSTALVRWSVVLACDVSLVCPLHGPKRSKNFDMRGSSLRSVGPDHFHDYSWAQIDIFTVYGLQVQTSTIEMCSWTLTAMQLISRNQNLLPELYHCTRARTTVPIIM